MFIPRTIEQIFNAILLEKQNMTTLNDLVLVNDYQDLLSKLTTNSKVSETNLWIYNTAVQIWALEQQMNEYRTEIDSVIDKSFVTTSSWWINQVLLWQEGDSIEINQADFNLYYPVVDENKRKIGSCAVKEQGGKLILKIRGKDTDLLSPTQLVEFTTYVNEVKPVGTQVAIWNYPSDKLKLYMTIKYNKQYDLATIKANVEATINDYIKNIEFNSDFNSNKLIDKLQLITGVIDPRLDTAYGRPDASITYTQFQHFYNSVAGYMSIDSLFPLDTTITYI